MKKILSILIIVISIVLVVTGCARKSEEPQVVASPRPAEPAVVAATPVAPVAPATPTTYEDGVYFAMADTFAASGWKDVVTLVVEGGKIVEVDWTGVNISGGLDKKSLDQAGRYNMVRFGGAQDEWHIQARRAEEHLIAIQDPAKITYSDDSGNTDDISGVSIRVSALFGLAQKALSQGPVGRGPHTDGAYFAIADTYAASGWREYVSLTVVNGRIASVNWSAVHRNGNDKKLLDRAGKYNMVRFGGAQDEWHVQAQKMEAYLIEVQDPKNITYSDNEGRTDAVSGVSIHVDALFTLATKALEAGPVSLGTFADGTYYASAQDFDRNGWKAFVSLQVKDGNIVNVYWSAINQNNEDKKILDMAGKYNMVAFGGAQEEWYIQAQKVEQFLLSSQNRDKESFVDAVSGVSISVDEFYTLVNAAFSAGVIRY